MPIIQKLSKQMLESYLKARNLKYKKKNNQYIADLPEEENTGCSGVAGAMPSSTFVGQRASRRQGPPTHPYANALASRVAQRTKRYVRSLPESFAPFPGTYIGFVQPPDNRSCSSVESGLGGTQRGFKDCCGTSSDRRSLGSSDGRVAAGASPSDGRRSGSVIVGSSQSGRMAVRDRRGVHNPQLRRGGSSVRSTRGVGVVRQSGERLDSYCGPLRAGLGWRGPVDLSED